jgi:hypothetical protein
MSESDSELLMMLGKKKATWGLVLFLGSLVIFVMPEQIPIESAILFFAVRLTGSFLCASACKDFALSKGKKTTNYAWIGFIVPPVGVPIAYFADRFI